RATCASPSYSPVKQCTMLLASASLLLIDAAPLADLYALSLPDALPMLPPGTPVKLEPRCSRLPRFSPFTPDAEPVAACASPSYMPLKHTSELLASAWLMVIGTSPLAGSEVQTPELDSRGEPACRPLQQEPRCS